MNVVAQTVAGWLAPEDRVRVRLRALAQRVAHFVARSGPPPAPMSATRSVQDSPTSRGSSPGESPAPPIAYPTAAGWLPRVPVDLREPPAPLLEQRTREQDRRFTERRIRDDGSPYGVERRTGAATRVGERRAADPATPEPSRLARSGVRGARAHDADYLPHLPDLLSRFHGR
jgi:hypothetical protein